MVHIAVLEMQMGGIGSQVVYLYVCPLLNEACSHVMQCKPGELKVHGACV